MAVLVIGEFRFPPERMADARAAMERVITTTRAEELDVSTFLSLCAAVKDVVA